MVVATQELELTARTVAHAVARFVQPRVRLGAKGIDDKLFTRQLGLIEIAAPDPVSPDVQLSGCTGDGTVGIGFGKRLEDNTAILANLSSLQGFGLPIFLGLSRKSFIGTILGVGVNERLIGTIAASCVAVLKGANIVRVHDVGETAQALKVASKITLN